MCSPALVILRGSNSAPVAALMIQGLALMKTYENYEILWIIRKDCYAMSKWFLFCGFFLVRFLFFSPCSGVAQKKAVMIRSFSDTVRTALRFSSPSQHVC